MNTQKETVMGEGNALRSAISDLWKADYALSKGAFALEWIDKVIRDLESFKRQIEDQRRTRDFLAQAEVQITEERNQRGGTVRCPDHRNGGAMRCPRGGAALQVWQRRQWGD